MRLLLIDNYDSFTWNLFQLLAEAGGGEPTVVRNDEVPLAAIERREFEGIVISPGPGRPDRAADFGECEEVIRRSEVPLLGVCLGHQGIASAFGGRVRPTEPVHGRPSWISHDGSPLFTGTPERFRAVRYHSLIVSELPDCLRTTARGEYGEVMALAHIERPIWGVQFHPESAGTPHGLVLARNFVSLVDRHHARRPRSTPAGANVGSPVRAARPRHEIVVRPLGHMPDPAAAFRRLFGEDPFAFWIDRESEGGRSVIGSAAGAGSEVLTYDVGSGAVRVDSPGTGGTDQIEGTIFDVLQLRLEERRLAPGQPFEFCGGYVGYLGYELKSDLGSPGRHSSPVPDACLIYATRLVVLDHATGEAQAIRVLAPGEDPADAEAEVAAMCEELAAIAGEGVGEGSAQAVDGQVRMALDRDGYLEAIAEAQRRLHAGDSYEICLTNRIEVEVGDEVDPLGLYLVLRALSPAPQAAYLRLGEVVLLSASPEGFLRIGHDGRATTSPIKGTRPRGADPGSDLALRDELRESAKEQAENMMIVDVLRNDLGRVCEVGSVEVERLMEARSFAQVHQLVSTISGRLAPGLDALDCLETCFPGGSMTGAPKLRAMEILDSLEPTARGPYSGAFGWFGLNGAAELSIVIRSIVLAGGVASVGAGGAITVLSDPEAEYEEMLLKARSLLEVLGSRSPAALDAVVSAP